jgi:hypothetical protein
MTDKKDETGRGAPRPGEGPRRPFATVDVQAKEVGGRDKGATGAAAGGERPDSRTAPLPPPGAKRPRGVEAALSGGVAAVRTWTLRVLRSNTFLSHVAAGVAGAVLTLSAGALLGLFDDGDGGERLSAEVSKRFAAVEQALKKRAAKLADDVGAKLAATDARVENLEERSRAVAELADAQAKLTAEHKALEARVASPALAERVAKLEAALTALSADDKLGGAALVEDLAAKLAELEKLAKQAGETAKSGASRIDRELAALKSQAGGLGQRLETLKSEIQERLGGVAKAGELAPVMARLAVFEGDLEAFLKREAERAANAQRVLLTLEIANLKRAVDRGDGYAKELEAVRKVAGSSIGLAPLERYSLDGVPTLGGLTRDFRRFANATVDAEREPADASVLDRLMAGARSIVRLRKAGHSADDASVEAIVGRMEAALKDGNVGEAIVQGRKLPPKAALAAEDWLRRLEARHTADRAIAEIEAALKSSLTAQRQPAPEPKR